MTLQNLAIASQSIFTPFRDVVCIQQDGNVEIITQHTQDLVFDKIGRLVEHWRLERILAQMAQQIRGVQV
jgi:hypothetical protein